MHINWHMVPNGRLRHTRGTRHQTQLDFKSMTVALAADHMERWKTPATSAAEQATRHNEFTEICGPAYPEYTHDEIASERVQQVAARVAKKDTWQHTTTPTLT